MGGVDIRKICRPLLVKGIKAVVFGIVRFLTISDHAFSYQAICCYLLSGPESRVDPPRQITNSGSVCTPQIHWSLSLFSRHKITEKQLSRRPPKTNRPNDP